MSYGLCQGFPKEIVDLLAHQRNTFQGFPKEIVDLLAHQRNTYINLSGERQEK